MKTSQTMKIGLVLGMLGCGVLSQALAQGFLNPVAAPAPTMKTLAQIHTAVELVEPRTALNFANTPGMSNYLYAVTNSGSYYLTENTTVPNGGILVLASDVTIDLSGFKLEGNPANSYSGIDVVGNGNVEVRNGTLARFGNKGIYGGVGDDGKGCKAVEVRVIQNDSHGIQWSGCGSIIDRCIAVSNGSSGFWAEENSIVMNSSSLENSGYGISVLAGSLVRENSVFSNGGIGIKVYGEGIVRGNSIRGNSDTGIHSGSKTLIQNNMVFGSGASGITAGYGCDIRDNVANGNNTNALSTGAGIYAGLGSFVVGNTVYTNEVQGIFVSGKAVTIENNMISGSPTGITFNVTGSMYVNNRFSLLATDVDGTATDGGGNISF